MEADQIINYQSVPALWKESLFGIGWDYTFFNLLTAPCNFLISIFFDEIDLNVMDHHHTVLTSRIMAMVTVGS